MNASGIFRKAALDRLSSPEQLDQTLTVASPRGWAAALVVAAAMAGVVVWSVVGAIPVRKAGQGLLIAEGGRVLDAPALGGGTLSELLVGLGDEVTAGEPVARISNPDLSLQLANLRAVVAERRDARTRLEQDLADEARLREASLAAQREALDTRLNAARSRLSYQQGRLSDLEALLAQKVVTRDALARARDEVAQARQDLAEVESGTADLRSRKIEADIAAERRRREADEAIAEAERRVAELEARAARGAVVTAPETGRVTEIKQLPGAQLSAGQAVLALQTGGETLEVVMFVPPADGKAIRPGMPVQISPSTAPRESFGTLTGELVSVSDFPVSSDGIRAIVDNPGLVESFVQAGPPFLARVRIDRDPSSTSGYHWTSSKGSDLALSAGTLASVEVETATERPIDMVIPLLKEWTGL